MPDIFISYSRRDKEFVQELFEKFKGMGRDVWVDWEDIPLTADWRKEISDGITGSDSFLFVISPDSVRSQECLYEVQQAVENKKKFVPILYREVTDPADQKLMHPAISSHNWLYFRKTDDYDKAFNSLVSALDTDLAHVRTHTRLLMRANEWDDKKRDSSFLLAGTDLQEAEAWLSVAVSKVPEPTQMHTEYLLESRKAEISRQRRLLIGAVAALVVTAVLAVFAVLQYFQAEEARQVAVERELESRSLAFTANAQSQQETNNDLAIALVLEANALPNPPSASQQALSDISLAPGTRRVISEHSSRVTDVEFSADGTRAYSSELNGTVIIWDTATYTPIRTFLIPDGVTYMSLSHDGSKLATGAANGVVGVWDASDEGSEEAIAIYEGHTEQVNSVTFSPDDTQVVSTSADKLAKVWELGQEEALITFEGHTANVRTAVFSPDGTQVLSAGNNSEMILWNAADGEEVRRYNGHSGEIHAVIFSPDGTQVLSGGNDATVRLWDVENGDEEITRFTDHAATVKTVVFSTDGRTIFSAGDDNQIIQWSLESGRSIQVLNGHTGFITHIAVSPDSMTLLSGADDNTIRQWDINNAALVRAFNGNNSGVFQVMGNGDGSLVAGSGLDGTVYVWDTQTRALKHRLEGSGTQVYRIAFSPDNSLIAASTDNGLDIWNTDTGAPVDSLAAAGTYVTAMAFGNDNQTLLYGAAVGDFAINLWNFETDERRSFDRGHTNAPQGLAVSPDGTQAVSVATDGKVILWNIADGSAVHVMEGHDGPALTVAFHPSGESVFTGGQDTVIHQWNTETGAELESFEGHSGPVDSIAVSPDGTRLISTSSGDGSLRLWDIATRAQLRQINPGKSIYAVAFNSDSTTIFTGGADGSVGLWDIQPATLEDLMRSTFANRYVTAFTCAERETYRLSPQCDESGAAPTRTPYPSGG